MRFAVLIIIVFLIFSLYLSGEQKEAEIPALIYFWPEVFTNLEFVYEGPDAKARAIADGLSGWGNCHAGAERPEFFGQGMVKIAKVLGVTATPENLKSLADEFLEQGRKDERI